MGRYSIKFVLSAVPSNDEEAKRLSIDVTQKYGSEGWRVISICALPKGGLLLEFEKEENRE